MVEEREAKSTWLDLPRAEGWESHAAKVTAMRHRALRWGANAAASKQSLREGSKETMTMQKCMQGLTYTRVVV